MNSRHEPEDPDVKIRQLEEALLTRGVCSMAIGMVMERMSIDEDTAVAFMVRLSQNLNRKLVDIAGDIVRTREIPTPPTPRRLHDFEAD